MSKPDSETNDSTQPTKRRQFTDEFKQEAVNMLLDGHTAASICERLGLSGPNLLYRWKQKLIGEKGTPASTLDARMRELEAELKRTQRERDVLKKCTCHFQPRRVTDVYAAIDQIVVAESMAASFVCDVIGVSRSGFCAWRSTEQSTRTKRDNELAPIIEQIFWRHRKRYGARRIAVELASLGIACGVARVARLLKTRGLRAIQPKSFKPRTTESRHRLGFNTNLLAGQEGPSKMNQVWVGDISVPQKRRERWEFGLPQSACRSRLQTTISGCV